MISIHILWGNYKNIRSWDFIFISIHNNFQVSMCLCMDLCVSQFFPSTFHGPIVLPSISMDSSWHGGCLKNTWKAIGNKISVKYFCNKTFVIPKRCPSEHLSLQTLVIPNLNLASAFCIKPWRERGMLRRWHSQSNLL